MSAVARDLEFGCKFWRAFNDVRVGEGNIFDFQIQLQKEYVIVTVFFNAGASL